MLWAALLLALLAGVNGDLYAQPYLPQIGGSGGGQFEAPCPNGRTLTGFELRAANYVDAIRPSGGFLWTHCHQRTSFCYRFVRRTWRRARLVCPARSPIVIGIDVGAQGVDTVSVNGI